MFHILTELARSLPTQAAVPALLTFSGYKFGGPSMGVVLHTTTTASPSSEEYLGTPDVASAVGCAVALAETVDNGALQEAVAHCAELRGLALQGLQELAQRRGVKLVPVSSALPRGSPFILSVQLPGYQVGIY